MSSVSRRTKPRDHQGELITLYLHHDTRKNIILLWKWGKYGIYITTKLLAHDITNITDIVSVLNRIHFLRHSWTVLSIPLFRWKNSWSFPPFHVTSMFLAVCRRRNSDVCKRKVLGFCHISDLTPATRVGDKFHFRSMISLNTGPSSGDKRAESPWKDSQTNRTDYWHVKTHVLRDRQWRSSKRVAIDWASIMLASWNILWIPKPCVS